MFEPGVNTWPATGLVIGAAAGGPLAVLIASDDVRATAAGRAEAADALPEAAYNAPDSRAAAARVLASVRERVRRFVIRFSSLENGESGRRWAFAPQVRKLTRSPVSGKRAIVMPGTPLRSAVT
jgi:hypothetical protein